MRCIPACLTLTLEGRNQFLIKANSSKVCLVINVFSIVLSLLILVTGITTLIFFSVGLGMMHSAILGMCVLAAVFFLVMNAYYLANRKHTVGMSALQNQRISQDSTRSSLQGVPTSLGTTQVFSEIQGELSSKNQQIQEMQAERERMSARILELEARALRCQEDQGRICGFEEQENSSLITLNNERRTFESRIHDLEQALSDAESQSQSHTSVLESTLKTLQEERLQLQNRIAELETTVATHAERTSATLTTELERQLAEKDEEIQQLQALKLQVYNELTLVQQSLDNEAENNGKIAKRFEKLRVALETERDEFRARCLELEAAKVQLEVLLSNASRSSSSNIVEYESEINRLNVARRNAEEKIVILQKKLNFKKEEISAIDAGLREKEHCHKEEISQLKQNQLEMSSRIQGLEQELIDAASEQERSAQAFVDGRSEYEREIAELKNTCSTLEKTMQDLRKEHVSSSNEVGNQVEAHQALRRELRELEDNITRLQRENEAKQRKVSQLDEEIVRISNAKMQTQRVAREQIANQVSKRKEVELELKESQSKTRELEATIGKLKREPGRTVVGLQRQIAELSLQIGENTTTISRLENRNRELERTVQQHTNKKSMKLTSDPERQSSIAKLEVARQRIRTNMSKDNKDRVRMAQKRIERLERLSQGSTLARQAFLFAEDAEKRIDYQGLFELESSLYDLFRSKKPATRKNRIDGLRALRLQQYCDGDAELEARVREFNFPPNTPIDSTALYELEQEILDAREGKLFSLRESLEDSNERILDLEAKIKELTEALRASTEALSPNAIERKSLAEQQEAQQDIQNLRSQLHEAHSQLEDYKTRFLGAQNELLKASLEIQSRDLAFKVAEDKLKSFEDKQ